MLAKAEQSFSFTVTRGVAIVVEAVAAAVAKQALARIIAVQHLTPATTPTGLMTV
jgi:hypothetical protein